MKKAALLIMAIIFIANPVYAFMFQNFQVYDDILLTSSSSDYSFTVGALVSDHETGIPFYATGTTFWTDGGLYDVFWFLSTESEVPEFSSYLGMLYSGSGLAGTIHENEMGIHTESGDRQFILFGLEQLSEFEPDVLNTIGFTFNTQQSPQNAPVPEPLTIGLLGTGLLFLGFVGRSSKMKK